MTTSRSIVLALLCLSSPARATVPNIARWEQQATQVTIIRDDWGIPHIYGKTDGDVVSLRVWEQSVEGAVLMPGEACVRLPRRVG